MITLSNSTLESKVEMGPDPTRAYFWPAVNKRPTRVLSDPTRSDFFLNEGKKIEKFYVFRWNFQNSNPNHKCLTRPEPQKIGPTRVKIFWPRPISSLKCTGLLLFCNFNNDFFDNLRNSRFAARPVQTFNPHPTKNKLTLFWKYRWNEYIHGDDIRIVGRFGSAIFSLVWKIYPKNPKKNSIFAPQVKKKSIELG